MVIYVCQEIQFIEGWVNKCYEKKLDQFVHATPGWHTCLGLWRDGPSQTVELLSRVLFMAIRQWFSLKY